jgi:hypothetical protein
MNSTISWLRWGAIAWLGASLAAGCGGRGELPKGGDAGAAGAAATAGVGGGGAGGGGGTRAVDAGTAGGGGAQVVDAGPAPATLSWNEGATVFTADMPTASRVRSGASDGLQVGANASGVALGLGVFAVSSALRTGTFACGDEAFVASVTYVGGGAASGVPLSCTVVITALGETGARAAGTFSATLPLDNGTTKVITNGKFDIPLTPASP